MPLYEYRCKECKRRFSLLVGMTAEKQKQACPHCGSPKLAKLISRIAPVKRGDDFEEDDFADDLGDDDYDDYDDFED